jgi:hypothetical protein
MVDLENLLLWEQAHRYGIYGCMEYTDSCKLYALDGVPGSMHGLRR